MKKMTMEDLRKRITYHQEGDFMVPDIGLPEEEEDEPELDLCQYFEHKKLKGYADFFNSSSSFCCGVI